MWSLLNCIIFVASWNVHSHKDTKVENKEYFCCLQTIQICFSDKKLNEILLQEFIGQVLGNCFQQIKEKAFQQWEQQQNGLLF